MPNTPANTRLGSDVTAADILNAIRSNASTNYRDMVPVCTTDLDSLHLIGNVVTSYTALRNEFLSSLYNRIAREIITSKLYYNPLSVFKRGMMDLGETIEEIYVNLAKGHNYDPTASEDTWFKKEVPDVRSAFHSMNYQVYYKATISNQQLRQAFLAFSGIETLIAGIVDSMYSAHNYDEFNVMKYMMARAILNGHLYSVDIDTIDKTHAADNITKIKEYSDLIKYDSTTYNSIGVYNHTPKEDQYLITTPAFDAIHDVNVLAVDFHMEKAEFLGHRIQIDGFGNIDNARMRDLFPNANKSGYVELTSDEKTALNTIGAVLVDKDFFMIFDNLYEFSEDYFGEMLRWNYWYHAWKTFSFSPFANAIVFTPTEPSITSVTVSPTTANVSKGGTAKFSATVVTAGFASQKVNWTVNSTHGSTMDVNGILHVSDQEVAGDLTVTATSVIDGTKNGTATVTVAA